MVDNKLVAKVEPGKEFNQPISKGNHTFTVLRAKDNMVLGSESVNVSKNGFSWAVRSCTTKDIQNSLLHSETSSNSEGTSFSTNLEKHLLQEGIELAKKNQVLDICKYKKYIDNEVEIAESISNAKLSRINLDIEDINYATILRIDDSESTLIINTNKLDFENKCDYYDKVVQNRVIPIIKEDVNNILLYSCIELDGVTFIDLYNKTFTVPIYKSSLNHNRNQQHEQLLNEIEKKNNAIKMYRDVLQALKKETMCNNIEIIDNIGGIALKTISLPYGSIEAKEVIIEHLKEKYSITTPKIENELADKINQRIDVIEKVVDIVPGGDKTEKIFSHYLWKIFKVTPELGKSIGHSATNINIIFRKKDYEQKIAQIELEKQELVDRKKLLYDD
jgi:hypothetical protein